MTDTAPPFRFGRYYYSRDNADAADILSLLVCRRRSCLMVYPSLYRISILLQAVADVTKRKPLLPRACNFFVVANDKLESKAYYFEVRSS